MICGSGPFKVTEMDNDLVSEPRTPPSRHTIREGEIFKSPVSSISGESGIDMKIFHLPLPRFSITAASEISVDSVFTEAYQNTINSNTSKQEFDRTAWETVYAIQERRKLVKPTFQGAVYNFLERPRGWKSLTYHCMILAAILACLLFSILTSVVEDNEKIFGEATFYMEITLVVFLTLEYIARLWSAGCRSKYLGLWGRIRFATKPISIIDLVIIVASFVVITFGSNGHVFATSSIRGVRFLQILRMLHMDRQGGSWRLLGSVIYMHKQELLTSLYIGFLGLVFSSYFMYLVEKDIVIQGQPSHFPSYADALWWGVVTMMTIGYGDKVPQTWAGRALACVSAMFTVSFFALPAGILGSGFALKVQQQQRQKHFSRQVPAAATLIQCLWRCYAADRRFNSQATWEIYLKHDPRGSPSKFKPIGLRLRRPKSKGSDPCRTDSEQKSPKTERNSFGEVSVELGFGKSGLHHSRSVPDMMIVMQDDSPYSQEKESTERLNHAFHSPVGSVAETLTDENENESQVPSRVTKLTEAHKNAIRAIRKIKYFVAKRKFQQARKPYDVGDVIEQYSQGQLSMMVRIKELQRRLDQILGKPGASSADRKGKQVTLGAKLHHLECQIQKMDKKLDSISFSIHALVKDLIDVQKGHKES